MFRFAPESGHPNGGLVAHRQCPQSPVWMAPALQELFEAWRLDQEQSCVRRPVGAACNFSLSNGMSAISPLRLDSETIDSQSDNSS